MSYNYKLNSKRKICVHTIDLNKESCRWNKYVGIIVILVDYIMAWI